MGIKSISYQNKAVEELIRKVDICIDENEKEFLFQAPTGSGKTVMLGLWFKQYLETHRDQRIAFLWISPGKGDLAGQSRHSINSLFEEFRSIDLSSLLNERELKPNTVAFINWEAINKKDNVAMREGEQANIYDALENSNLDRLIVVVDESHEARNSIKAVEILDTFKPDIVIDVTATPRNNSAYYKTNTVKVSIHDVIREEFIKRQVIINDGLEQLTEEEVLKTAIEKRDAIEQAYREVEPNCKTPLLLVQIENESKVDTELGKQPRAEHIASVIENLGVDYDDIAIWVSDKKVCRNLADIKNSDVKVLIFKSAIATGYDIDRAHILAKLRDVKSMTFNAQVLGRVLRTQNKKFYQDDLIDSAYIYTEFDTFEYTLEVDDEQKDTIKQGRTESRIKAKFKENFPKYTIPMYRKETEFDHKVDTKLFRTRINKELTTEFVEELRINDEKLQKSLFGGRVDTTDIDSAEFGKTLEEKKFTLPDNKVLELYKKTIRHVSKHQDVSKMVFNILKRKNTSVTTPIEIMRLYLSNIEEINDKILKATSDYYELALKKGTKQMEYTPPEVVYYRDVLPETAENYAYTKQPSLDVSRTKSSSEGKLAAFLEFNPDVKWWYKNEIGGENFSLCYEAESYDLNLYYPDFFIIDKNDKLYIVDVKAPIKDAKSNDYKNIHAKYNAGKVFESRHRFDVEQAGFSDIECSMIKFRDEVPYICKTQAYSEDYADINKWPVFEL